MATIHRVTTLMPAFKDFAEGAIFNYPEGHRYGEQEIKRQALVDHRALIASGAPVEVTVPGYGTVSFEFRASKYYSAPGAKDGTFRPL